MDLAAVVVERMPTVGLVLLRIAGIVAVAPPFAVTAVPVALRGLLALILTLVVVPAAPVWEGAGAWAFAAAAAGELAVGLAVGLLILLLLLAVQGAGELIDMEMGFGMVNVIDPAFGRPVPLLGNFLYFVALVIFLAVDGHLLVLRALLDSFQVIPPGGGRWDGPIFAAVVEHFSWVIVTAVRIALPVVGVLFLTTMALGVLARTMPQLNVFMVGLALKITLGLTILGLVLPALNQVFLDGFEVTFTFVRGFIRALGGQ